jgi:hypothetical protein
MLRRVPLQWFVPALSTLALGCTSFATVRSADVRPGPAFSVQASAAPSPGPVAGWLWSFDCAEDCDHTVPGLDLTFAYGQRKDNETPYSIGLGSNSLFPFAEAYVQLRDGERFPFGLGARVGIPLGPGWENQLYARLDVPITRNARLLWNPGVFHNSTSSPNGANHGSFVGRVQGFGLELGAGVLTLTPSVAIVWGRAEYTNPELHGPENRIFGMGALSLTLGRPVPRTGR